MQAGARSAEKPEGRRAPIDFNQKPFIAIWEITRACPLACIHCRAEAQPHPHPDELTTAEGFAVIDQVAEAGVPLFVLTGGDPMQRADVYDLIEYAVGKGLHTSFSPSATGRLAPDALKRCKELGLVRAALSLDGASAETHDGFRGVKGSYRQTMRAIGYVRDSGIGLQLQTTVSRYNLSELRQVADFVAEAGALMWNVFFLVPTGRGRADDMISAAQHEEIFNWLYDLSVAAPFDVKTTAAPHYRRVVLQRRQAEGVEGPPFPGVTAADGVGRAAFEGVNDGKGFVFVTHLGEVCPSGFLQLPAGSVRREPLMDVYRDSKLFRDLRDAGKIKGKCGRCDYREVCGGSRARAYAVTGDYLESEPLCAYEPQP
jgi:radical SAM protein